MKNKKALLSAVFAAFMLLSACGGSTQKDTSAQDSSTTSQVASASDMADVEDVVEDGMTPITGDKVKDGLRCNRRFQLQHVQCYRMRADRQERRNDR